LNDFYLTLYFMVLLFGIIKKLLDAIHVSMIRQSQCIHAVFGSFIHETVNAGHAIQDRIMRVNVKMNKGIHIKRLFIGLLRSQAGKHFWVAKDTDIFGSRSMIVNEVIDNSELIFPKIMYIPV